MKKILLLIIRNSLKALSILIALLVLHLKANSQKTIGLSFGGNLSYLQFNEDEDNSPLPGYGLKAGLVYQYTLNHSFSIEFGVCYSQKGQRNKYENDLPVTHYGGGLKIKAKDKFKLNYFHIPVALNFYFNKNVFVSAGGYLAYCRDGAHIRTEKFYNLETNEMVNEETSVTELYPESEIPSGWYDGEVYRKFEYGLGCGIGYKLGRFAIKGEFEFGLSPALEKIQSTLFDTSKKEYKNRLFSINLIYNIIKN